MSWKNQGEKRRNTPSSSMVYQYWFNKQLPSAKDNRDVYLEENTCFACGIFYPLQRAHIIPLIQDGDNSLDNIHLLCISCHSRSEGNKKYWSWLTFMRKHEWKFRWEWCIKILEMNGVNIKYEADKTEKMGWNERILYISDLLKDNGIYIELSEEETNFLLS